MSLHMRNSPLFARETKLPHTRTRQFDETHTTCIEKHDENKYILDHALQKAIVVVFVSPSPLPDIHRAARDPKGV